MGSCALCGAPVAGPRLVDAEAGTELHPACVARRAPQEIAVALISVLALAVAAPVVVWAG
jgi:hypothetical protein